MKRFVNFLFFTFIFASYAVEEKPFAIVIPSYNNKEWFELNLTSVLSQNYRNYRVIYVDDCSRDGMTQAIDQFLAANDPEKRVRIIHNRKRIGALANIYYAVHACAPDEIVALLDGDDWFLHADVLKELNEVYSASKDIWFTHGNMMEWPTGHVTWCEPVPEEIIASRNYRSFKCPSHLRTFYAWIFQRIRFEDFLYNGKFYEMAWDMAIMYPILEMAGPRHAFIEEANYAYNMHNPINDNKVNAELQNKLDQHLRAQKPYPQLTFEKEWPNAR